MNSSQIVYIIPPSMGDRVNLEIAYFLHLQGAHESGTLFRFLTIRY